MMLASSWGIPPRAKRERIRVLLAVKFQSIANYEAGRAMVKTAPPTGELCASMIPPWFLMMPLQTERPMPTPIFFPEV